MTKPAALALAVLLALAPAAPASASAAPSPEPSGTGSVPEGSEILFRLTDPRITESSGLAASSRHEGVYWTHNDSGEHAPEVYAVDGDGTVLATVTLSGDGVELRDWEAVALGTDEAGEPAVYVGDIGDNFQGGWPNVRVYRFTEPADLADATVEAEAFTFTYADGGRDAEAMMVDPRDGRLYIISKEIAGGVYAAPEELDPDAENTLERVDSAPLYATDASFSPDGSYYAVRTYWGATFYDAADGVPGRSAGRIGLPETDQGESLAFTADGSAVLAGTEGPESPVWRVPVPDHIAEGAGEQPPSPDPSAAEEGEEQAGSGPSATALILTGAGVAAAVIIGIVLLVRRS
ncbi:SdiA-regulated/phytase-like domain-containing protein [Nocardiopsis potens]|uniref:hypothetical protein n=1 Tax=Nocardiopsis potens TaxID=1246458 RepID=UPI00034CBC9C|nr:hypothetical protein [Nocardiopsis potens]